MGLGVAEYYSQGYDLAFSATPGDTDQGDQDYHGYSLEFSAAQGGVNQDLSAALGNSAFIAM